MKTKIMVTYSVSMHSVPKVGIKFPKCTVVMSYRSISSHTYVYPVGSYIFPKREIGLPDSSHHCYTILKNFCRTLNTKFGGNIEAYIIHCVKKFAPDFIHEVDAMYDEKAITKTYQEKINDLVTATNLLTNGTRTIEVEIDT